MKVNCVGLVVGHYGLAPGCMDHVQSLISKMAYIYPMNAKVSAIVTRPCYCSTECYINQTKKIDGTRPYQNPIIPAIISGEFFICGLALSEAENINRFHVEGFDEPKLPPSIVAFGATGVHFIL